MFGGIGGSLYSWHSRSGRCLQTYKAHYKDISSILCHQNFLLTASDDGQLGIFKINCLLDVQASVKPEVLLNAHQQPITDLFVSSNLLFSASLDFTVKIWDLEKLNSKTENEKIEQSKIIVTSVEFPSAVSSITCDGLNMVLVACAMDGRFEINNVYNCNYFKYVFIFILSI